MPNGHFSFWIASRESWSKGVSGNNKNNNDDDVTTSKLSTYHKLCVLNVKIPKFDSRRKSTTKAHACDVVC